MGLFTTYLGHAVITPSLNADEVEFLQAFNRTRHCADRKPLDVALHPADNGDDVVDAATYNAVPAGMPNLWCPWTVCSQGCCLRWDGAEKPYSAQPWLVYLITTFLRPRATLADDPAARRLGLTFDHRLHGMLVGERQETAELFVLAVRNNAVARRVLVPGAEGADDWGYRDPADEQMARRVRLEARRERFRQAIAVDRAAAG